MWPQCGPLPPKPEAGMATGRRTGQPSPVRLGTVAMLASTSPTTDASTAHGRRAPLARERREGSPALPQSAKGVAGSQKPATPLPRSMRHIKETRRGKATVRALEAAHCSHAYLDGALVIRGEATVSSHRQDPGRWGRPVDQEAGSRRDPPVGGPQQPAEKPASIDTDGWDQIPAGLPLYPRGVGLYKPPGAPMQRVGF